MSPTGQRIKAGLDEKNEEAQKKCCGGSLDEHAYLAEVLQTGITVADDQLRLP
jgi:hypothetical protein